MPLDICRYTEDASAVSCCPDLVVTLKKKMKSFEKFKRRMGLSQTNNCGSNGSHPNNLAPLQFHSVHGANIRLGENGTRASRVDSYCKGIVFSQRPVACNERVYLRLSAVSSQWSGAVRLGFTSVDPRSLNSQSLPKYACPDLTKRNGFWAKAMSERYTEPGTTFFYYFTASGDVHFGVNDIEERSVLFSGVDASRPLWMLLDVYGNATSVDVINPLRSSDNSCQQHLSEEELLAGRWGQPVGGSPSCVARQLPSQPINQPLPAPPAMLFHPAVRGRNVVLSSDRRSATRVEDCHCNAYVFGESPLSVGQPISIQLMERRAPFIGCLTVGVTSCNPAHLTVDQLPDNADRLLERPEYWALVRDAGASLAAGTRITLVLSSDSRLLMSVDDAAFVTLMHVDTSVPIWPVFDLFGSTGRLRAVGVCDATRTSIAAVNRMSPITNSLGTDCAVCLDRESDAALYSCGHVCMCFECAVQWKARPGAGCPICRAPIRDVIRLYRS